MPFIIGVHSSHLPLIKKLPVDEILYVNLDNGDLKAPHSLTQELKNIPVKWGNQLKQDLTMALTTYQHGRTHIDNPGISLAFRTFFYSMLYDYQNYFQVSSNGAIEFCADDFLNSLTKENRPITQQFCSSQLFHTYVYEVAARMESQSKPQHQFEKDLFQYVQTHPRG